MDKGKSGTCPDRTGDEGAECDCGGSSGFLSVSATLEYVVVVAAVMGGTGWLACLLAGTGGGWKGGGVGEMAGLELVVADEVPAREEANNSNM